MTRLVLHGGTVVNGDLLGAAGAVRADVAIDGERIVAVGASAAARPGDTVIDCSGRFVMPGFVDAHSHADGTVFDTAVQTALLRQGVTTVVIGQDGVSFAPGSGEYARTYFGALNGDNPHYRGGSVSELLSTYDGRIPVNVGYLIPAGTVRHEVLGSDPSPASQRAREAMARLVERRMIEGALGLSTGLDYVPGIFADPGELAELCTEVARYDGVHVSHMRGGYERSIGVGLEELAEIAERSGVRTHVSHLHAPPDLIAAELASLGRRGHAVTFDAYPYRKGCTLLAMLLVDPALLAAGPDTLLGELADPASRARLVADTAARAELRPDLGEGWAAAATFAHAADPAWSGALGRSIEDVAAERGITPVECAIDALADSRLEVTVVVGSARPRGIDDLARILSDPRHLLGSDGIYVGGHPHPRGWGTFARFLGRHVRERSDLEWTDAVDHLSAHAVHVFGLGRRGRVEAGWIADLAVVDPLSVEDASDYGYPRATARGVDDVVVAGAVVLRGGELTGVHPGGGLRRQKRITRKSGESDG